MDVEIATGDIQLWLLDAVSEFLLTVSQTTSCTSIVSWEARSPHHHSVEEVLDAISSLEARGLVKVFGENGNYEASNRAINEYCKKTELSSLRFRLTEAGVAVWERFSCADYHKYVRLDFLPDTDGFESLQFTSLSEENALSSAILHSLSSESLIVNMRAKRNRPLLSPAWNRIFSDGFSFEVRYKRSANTLIVPPENWCNEVSKKMSWVQRSFKLSESRVTLKCLALDNRIRSPQFCIEHFL